MAKLMVIFQAVLLMGSLAFGHPYLPQSPSRNFHIRATGEIIEITRLSDGSNRDRFEIKKHTKRVATPLIVAEDRYKQQLWMNHTCQLEILIDDGSSLWIPTYKCGKNNEGRLTTKGGRNYVITEILAPE